MSLKTRLRLLVATLVAVLVLSVSTIYVGHFTRNEFSRAAASARSLANDVLTRVQADLQAHPQPAASAEETQQQIEKMVREDATISHILASAVESSSAVLDVSIVSGSGI